MIGGSRRKFICKRCNKLSYDQGDMPIQSKEHGMIEFDVIDLCTKCFFIVLKEYRQNVRLVMLVQTGKITTQDLEMAGKDPKYRAELLRRNNYKEGELKERQKVLIERLRKETRERNK